MKMGGRHAGISLEVDRWRKKVISQKMDARALHRPRVAQRIPTRHKPKPAVQRTPDSGICQGQL
jgi:hypothetical protein